MTAPTKEEVDAQIELEAQARMIGIDKLRASVAKAKGTDREGGTMYGKQLVPHSMASMTEAVRDWVNEWQSGKTGRMITSAQYIPLLGPDVAAYLTLRTVVNSLSSKRTLTATALALGHTFEDEVRLSYFSKENPNAAKWTVERAQKAHGTAFKRGVIKKLMQLKGSTYEGWAKGDRLAIGVSLLEICAQATGLVNIVEDVSDKGRKAYFIVPTETTQQWIRDCMAYYEMTAAEYWPMICKPRQWKGLKGGGYYSHAVRSLPLIKPTRHRSYRGFIEDLANHDLSAVYASVNAIQDTPWKVNKKVYECIAEVVRSGRASAGLDFFTDPEIPPKPADIDTNEDAKKWWKKGVSIAKRQQVEQRSKRVQLFSALSLAKRFVNTESIYFPYQLDFRGRAYPITHHLQPQGPDQVKALLTFSDGSEITESGRKWLAIHGANCYGIDKVDFTTREVWTLSNQDQILEAATDPLGQGWSFWQEADSPFQFLAFCFEWAGLVEADSHGVPFTTTLPIQMDGTCNGLQHYSAALRDPIGALATNLIPSDKPQDIYQIVADKTTESLRGLKDLSGDEGAYARAWLEAGVTRSTAKRPVMTLPYGAGLHSCRQYIADDAADRGIGHLFEGIGPDHQRPEFAAALFLGPILWDAIGETVIAAREGMEWLQQCARVIVKEDLPIHWSLPDGFIVHQAYAKMNPRTVKTRIYGKVVRPVLLDTSDDLDARKQAQGIAPNWVHSMDAYALREYVRLAEARGIRHFSVIHDSFGCLATDVDVMNACIRQAFVSCYAGRQPLHEFLNQAAGTLSAEALSKIPDFPAVGDLALDAVADSDYFFC